MFVDASEIVAILTHEPEAELLEGDPSLITSPIAIFEAPRDLQETACERRGGRARRR
jgi:uncharacterized protein with PIN domain